MTRSSRDTLETFSNVNSLLHQLMSLTHVFHIEHESSYIDKSLALFDSVSSTSLETRFSQMFELLEEEYCHESKIEYDQVSFILATRIVL